MAVTAGLLLDTHTWLWQQNKELRMNQDLRDLLEQAASLDQIFVSSFSFYELTNAVLKKRVQLHPNPASWFKIAFAGRSVRVINLTPAIALKTMDLPEAFHGDPGDRIIVATAIAENLTLLTHDKALLRYGKQGLVKVVKVNQIRSSSNNA
jgi:PIN domain nuclease of toxin-antitoxin system